MRKLLFIAAIAFLVYGYIQNQELSFTGTSLSNRTDIALQNADTNRQSDVQIKGVGTVIAILSDDLDGSRHQRFILRLSSGQTLLISHNIGLAPRIDRLSSGDTVEFFGEYEWNSKGGVIHWTHHDPAGQHIAGWLKHQGKTYQ